jgi:hypothetical protein
LSVQADEIERRKQVALVAIRDSFGTEEDDYGVTLFVSHHLEELDASYWLSRLGISDPDPEKVISLLELYSHWGEKDEDGIDVFDFTLPDKVTNYVISVRFDAMGSIEDISMEC